MNLCLDSKTYNKNINSFNAWPNKFRIAIESFFHGISLDLILSLKMCHILAKRDYTKTFFLIYMSFITILSAWQR